MSIRCEYYFTSADQKTLIHVNQWTPLGREIRGVVQIAHGVAEYGARYAPFADYLCKNGYVVVANDHLGHGKSLIEGRPMVYLGDENGWENVVKDIESIRAHREGLCRKALFPLWSFHGLVPRPHLPDPLSGKTHRMCDLRHGSHERTDRRRGQNGRGC